LSTPVSLNDRFSLAAPPARVASVFSHDVPGVVGCIPGASVTADHGDGSYSATIGVHYGDTGVRFTGVARLAAPAPERLLVHAEGQDGVGTIKATGDITLQLSPEGAGGTAVELSATFDFSGLLAPLARSATKIVGPQLIRSFTRCLTAKVANADDSAGNAP
jgi:carbon-monoxide dehydrogenase small subunit